MVKAIPGRKKDPSLRDASEELEECIQLVMVRACGRRENQQTCSRIASSGVKSRHILVEQALEVSSVGDFVDGGLRD